MESRDKNDRDEIVLRKYLDKFDSKVYEMVEKICSAGG